MFAPWRQSLFFHPALLLWRVLTMKGKNTLANRYQVIFCVYPIYIPWTCCRDLLHDDVSTSLDREVHRMSWPPHHFCVVTPPSPPALLHPSLFLSSALSAARFLPHFNPDASAPLLGQTPSPEDDSVIRDLLPEDAGIDHQTVHQLIMVLMKFMAKDQSSAEADIGSAKAFNTVKRHLYVLLGYDQQEGCFMIAPQKMRTSTCFNAFIAGIAQVTNN